MESSGPEPDKPRTVYVIHTTVRAIEFHQRIIRTNRDGSQVREPIGWFVQFEGSNEDLFISKDQPGIAKGQKATIRIEFE
jgi:hypothetical protein